MSVFGLVAWCELWVTVHGYETKWVSFSRFAGQGQSKTRTGGGEPNAKHVGWLIGLGVFVVVDGFVGMVNGEHEVNPGGFTPA